MARHGPGPDGPEAVGTALLGHQLRPAVGADRPGGRVLRDRDRGHGAVHGRGRREDERRDAGGDAALDQGVADDGVVAVVEQRLAHRLVDPDRAREMQHGGKPPGAEHGVQQAPVAGVALDQRHVRRQGRRAAARQVVEHQDRPAGFLERQNDMAADVAGAARDEHVRPARGLPHRDPDRPLYRLVLPGPGAPATMA